MQTQQISNPLSQKGSLCYWNKIFFCQSWYLSPGVMQDPLDIEHFGPDHLLFFPFQHSLLLTTALGIPNKISLCLLICLCHSTQELQFCQISPFAWDFSPHRILYTEFYTLKFPVSISQISPTTKILH